ncbi:hypothetical protein [Alkalicoccus saliphilus]|uniref:Uncharacterized protein n=1 Tax=Alkalicoccus saliphilus TaxID=200989 RepID=A0A2T4U2Z7_9BACI|nr:hypothetical protein [Alkalicoccus saliphilus]PTL37759.1 hypothetical protein C6Y45_14715 [Alkalicoccus saliphilus]
MNRLTIVIIMLLAIIFLFYSFITLPYIVEVMGVLTLLLYLLLVFRTKWLTLIISFLMVGSGFYLSLPDDSLREWSISFTSNLPLILLILTVPVLSIPLQIGKYDIFIKDLIKTYGRNPKKLYFTISLTFFFLGPILNLAVIKIVDSLLQRVNLPVAFLGKAYSRGFTATIAWSPFYAALLLVLLTLDMSLMEYLPYGIFLGILHLITANLVFMKESKNIDLNFDAGKNVRIRPLLELCTVFLTFFLTIYFLGSLFAIEMIPVIILSVVITAIIWSIYIGQTGEFFKETKYYGGVRIFGSANEVILFLSAGFFGAMAAQTTVGDSINILALQISDWSILLFIIFLISTTTVLAFFGIHQIVTITIFATSIAAEEAGISTVIFALILMSAWAIATLFSPITPVNVIITNILRVNIFKVILHWNGKFVLLLIFIYSLIIYGFYLY